MAKQRISWKGSITLEQLCNMAQAQSKGVDDKNSFEDDPIWEVQPKVGSHLLPIKLVRAASKRVAESITLHALEGKVDNVFAWRKKDDLQQSQGTD